jgi:hypothetical protein
MLFTVTTASGAAQLSPHAQKRLKRLGQLREIPIDTSGMESGPPTGVPGLLRTRNAELKALVVEDLGDLMRRQLLSESELLDQLRAAGWEEIPSHKWLVFTVCCGSKNHDLFVAQGVYRVHTRRTVSGHPACRNRYPKEQGDYTSVGQWIGRSDGE